MSASVVEVTKELHLSNVSGIVFADDQVSVVVESDLPNLAHPGISWSIEVGAVSVLRRAVLLPINEQMSDPCCIDVPDVAPIMCS